MAGRNRPSVLDAYDEAGHDPVSDRPVIPGRGREVVEGAQFIFFSVVIGCVTVTASLSNDDIRVKMEWL
jgi:hypothetical protein